AVPARSAGEPPVSTPEQAGTAVGQRADDKGPGHRARRWFLGRREVRRMGWRHTDALTRAVVCGFGLAVTGVVLHRLELLLVGAPLLVSVLLTAPPRGNPTVRAARLADTAEAGRFNEITVNMDPGEGAVIAALRMPMPSRSGVGPVHMM